MITTKTMSVAITDAPPAAANLKHEDGKHREKGEARNGRTETAAVLGQAGYLEPRHRAAKPTTLLLSTGLRIQSKQNLVKLSRGFGEWSVGTACRSRRSVSAHQGLLQMLSTRCSLLRISSVGSPLRAGTGAS